MTSLAVAQEDLADSRLVLVVCPQCGKTAGVLPASDAYHHNERMRPVDPDGVRQARIRAKEALRAKSYRSRAPLKRDAEGQKTGV